MSLKLLSNLNIALLSALRGSDMAGFGGKVAVPDYVRPAAYSEGHSWRHPHLPHSRGGQEVNETSCLVHTWIAPSSKNDANSQWGCGPSLLLEQQRCLLIQHHWCWPDSRELLFSEGIVWHTLLWCLKDSRVVRLADYVRSNMSCDHTLK